MLTTRERQGALGSTFLGPGFRGRVEFENRVVVEEGEKTK